MQVTLRGLQGPFGIDQKFFGFGVGQQNVVDVDVAPTSLGIVEDPQDSLFSNPLRYIPKLLREFLTTSRLVVGPCGAAHHLPLDP